MAFSYTKNQLNVIGNRREVTGTYTNTGGSTGGTIVTGLTRIESFSSSTNVTQAATTNKSDISGGSVVLTTVADEDGTWRAVGF